MDLHGGCNHKNMRNRWVENVATGSSEGSVYHFAESGGMVFAVPSIRVGGCRSFRPEELVVQELSVVVVSKIYSSEHSTETPRGEPLEVLRCVSHVMRQAL
jgi:hypothetical protein